MLLTNSKFTAYGKELTKFQNTSIATLECEHNKILVYKDSHIRVVKLIMLFFTDIILLGKIAKVMVVAYILLYFLSSKHQS